MLIQWHRVNIAGDLWRELWTQEVSHTGICTGCASASREGLMTVSNTSLGQTVPVLTQSAIKDFGNTADTDLLVLTLHILLQ